jgi:haloalkane dehalogenase
VEVKRTPDACFERLDGFPFAPCYAEVKAEDGTPLRVHYVDEGPRGAAPIVLLHGNPSWSYLYRKIIPRLVAGGQRVLAPDLVGLGRSDKPAAKSDYSLARHVDWMSQWLLAVGVENATLFAQDWGGVIGFPVAMRHPERFVRLIAANTGLPTGQGASQALQDWLDYSDRATSLPVAQLVHGFTVNGLTESERRAYDAPFPDASHQAAALSFPRLIPLQPENPGVPLMRETWEQLERWTKPFLTLFGDRDPISKGAELGFQQRVPGAKEQPHVVLSPAHHFLQEDQPEAIAERVLAFVAVRPRAAS